MTSITLGLFFLKACAVLAPMLWTQMRKGGALAPSIGPAARLGPSPADEEEAMPPADEGLRRLEPRGDGGNMSMTWQCHDTCQCHGNAT